MDEVTRKLKSFPGFAAPTSNTTFIPNQLFDVCLPHYSRSVIRLVSYMLRQALGWCDADGNPRSEHITVSFRELAEKAGISGSELRKALDDAIAGHFIECVREGRPARAGSPAVTAIYQLRWDPRPEYIKDPKQFRGFYEGQGHRTDIPNQFLDLIIPVETLSVIRVVGSIARFSIGFQAARGARRQQVPLSLTHIQRYCRTKARTSLVAAVRLAEEKNYIRCLDRGYFDPNAGRTSRAAVFMLRWADTSPLFQGGRKNIPVEIGLERLEIGTGSGRKSIPEKRLEKHTGIETKLRKENSKQQQTHFQLRKVGFSEKTASEFLGRFEPERVERQVQWLPYREATNPVGLLRKAIEEDWPAPEEVRRAEAVRGMEFGSWFYAAMAGNHEKPAAQPSAKEAAAAQELLDQLPGTLEVKGLAVSFANLVRERRKPNDLHSLVLAIRMHGNSWIVQRRREDRERLREEEERRKEAYRAKHQAGWFEFLRLAEESCRQSRPEEYAGYLASKPRWPVPQQSELINFQKHFHMPDFWQWDAQYNQT